MIRQPRGHLPAHRHGALGSAGSVAAALPADGSRPGVRGIWSTEGPGRTALALG